MTASTPTTPTERHNRLEYARMIARYLTVKQLADSLDHEEADDTDRQIKDLVREELTLRALRGEGK